MPRLSRAFFARPCLEVARELVGCVLLRTLDDGTRLAGRLVEVEAYRGDGGDPASHSHGGETPRNRSMFGPPGRLYVYQSYGIHRCVNLVCEPRGRGAAVLLRALEPLEGVETQCALRGVAPPGAEAGPRGRRTARRDIASGPGRLAQALGLDLEHDGASALGAPVRVMSRPPGHRVVVCRGPRVGIRRAADLPYRFTLAGSPWVSPYRPGRPGRSAPPRRGSAAAP